MVDRYVETAVAYQFERLFGPTALPLTAGEKQLLRSAEKALVTPLTTIELEIEKLDALPAWARGAFARGLEHDVHRITALRSGLPLERRPGRESIHEVVNRFCYR